MKIIGGTNENILWSLDAIAGTGKTFNLNFIILKLLNEWNKLFSTNFEVIYGTILIGVSTFIIQKRSARSNRRYGFVIL